MKQIRMKHKTLKIRTCADCPIMHDGICDQMEKQIFSIVIIPDNCPLEDAV